MKELIKFAFLKRINYVTYNLNSITLTEAMEYVRNGNMTLYDKEYGNYTLRQAIEYIRRADEKDREALKFRLLPAVAYNGIFHYVDAKGIDEYSCITAMDFDHISTQDELVHLRNRLIKTPCVVCVFVTPSGRGVKALVLHDNTDPDKHTDLYNQLLDKFNVASKDTGCKDLARRNYLSYDPDIWVNPNPTPYNYIPSLAQHSKPIPSPCRNKKVSDRSIISIMNATWKRKNPEYWMEGSRASSIFKAACLMCRWGVDESLASEYFVNGWESDTMSEKEILEHVGNAYKAEQDNFGTWEFRIY